jgi:acyl carrier protein
MHQPGPENRLDRDMVLGEIVEILEGMLSEWEGFEGEIGPETLLVNDLDCSSVEIVELAVTIEDHFDAPNLPFQELLMTANGQYIDDLRVSELVDFVSSACVGRAAERKVAG